MSKLSQLLEKPERVTIGNVEMDLYPLTADDLVQIGIVDENNPDPVAVKRMIRVVLKKAVPDVTEEEINNFPAKYINELAKHIQRINNVVTTSDAEIRLREKLDRLKAEKNATQGHT